MLERKSFRGIKIKKRIGNRMVIVEVDIGVCLEIVIILVIKKLRILDKVYFWDLKRVFYNKKEERIIKMDEFGKDIW